ncbi:homogentisate 1,2-dioxygenase [Microbacterium sp. CPCC 204701]|uniref:homogentisate 1,2-dioxygenase n=1 Tax=Microbacterium sp. CPCC 204701 TaxID=2493084 RepID=UPI000FDA9DA0|nr:homogentisate 1,2-dioxygenase [Microbacterium sp. CPCC 204701]
MPYFRTMGSLPTKRRTLFPKPDGGYYSEELVGEEGFSSDLSHAYHVNPPTAIVKAERVERDPIETTENWPLIPRHIRTGEISSGSDVVMGRVPLLTNSDVTIGFVTATESSELYRDASGDECIYIYRGSATLRSMFGPLEVKQGDYVVIPAGVVHQWVPGEDGVDALTIESKGHIKPPRRYLSKAGQFLEMAPYRERDLRGPVELPEPEVGEADVIVKRDGLFSRITYRFHPFDLVGWNGMVYPYAFSIYDFEPIVGRIHQPPPVHQTFEGPGFVLCSFVPRLSDYDPDAVGGPAAHMNIDSDEVMFYAGGDYAARSGSGIGLGSMSLHPLGWTHGPQKLPDGKRKPGVMLDELAVMVDTFQPLKLTSAALAVEDPSYVTSWDRSFGGANG